MKPSAVVLLLLVSVSLVRGSQAFIVEDIGVLITMPNTWQYDETDSFGYVLRPLNDNKRKIRIHLTDHKNIPLDEAVRRASANVNKTRKGKEYGFESILSSEPFTTASGITGRKAVIGNQGVDGPSYLDRYYFQMLDGRVFCVCVYHYGNLRFSKNVQEVIMNTLFFKK